MGLKDFLTGANNVSNYTAAYSPCGQECSKCRKGHCTKHDGHTAMAGHQSVRGYNSALEEDGCGHSW